MPDTFRDRLTRTVYLFGSAENGPYGLTTFHASGRIHTRYNPAEYRYRICGDHKVELISSTSKVTSALTEEPDGVLFANKGHPHYLRPVFKLPPPARRLRRSPVFINTVPKSGTYLMALALQKMGYTNSELHVSDNSLHDNRGVPESSIHWNPAAREVPVPAHAVASLLQPGEFCVGHLNSEDRMRAVMRSNVHLVNLLREPCSQLVSMYIFQKKKVQPTAEVALWHDMPPEIGFPAFLLSSPVQRWLEQMIIIRDNFRFLRLEDVRAGVVPRLTWRRLGLPANTGNAVTAALGQPTSTYLPGDRAEIIAAARTPKVQTYLEEIGVMAISREIWPDHQLSDQQI